MGAIALLRQTYLDGQWYARQETEKERNLSLAAWGDVQPLPQIFEVGNLFETLRAAKVGAEFGHKYYVKENGDSYRRLDAIKKAVSGLIVPVNFPKPYDVSDPYDAQMAPYSKLKHWEWAPFNLSKIEAAQLPFAITAHGLKKPVDLILGLHTAVKHGLSRSAAIEALTTTPAKWVGMEDRLGQLKKGFVAYFFITDHDLFDSEVKVLEHWVNGKQHVLKENKAKTLTGTYDLLIKGERYNVAVTEDKGKAELALTGKSEDKQKASIAYNGRLLHFVFTTRDKMKITLSGYVNDTGWIGRGKDQNGEWFEWKATRKNKTLKKGTDENDETAVPRHGILTYPFTSYGFEASPATKTYLIKEATVWTNESAGILKKTDVLIRNGNIVEIGTNIQDRSATVVDGKGKHLTSGIIDEHSHIGIIRGVNEGTQSSSAEVRIGDVINSEDINIYRQLAGGVTTAQLLHGSANPIGGQSAIIKFRWGSLPEEMKFEGADGFIKFALGENVKQSNWGDQYDIRFPQTRMGVEQVFDDYFLRALSYGEKKTNGELERIDLELEAILEIIQSKRFISCHSYRQSEINMLMKIAEKYDFRINTFTHILEGYKVADKMAAHGAGGSTFSDWWAYKHEVIDAIPHNGAIMHEQGVVTAFNSDDAEMARRLNQEAAKAVLYGGVSEEDAWKFVTLNPAKLLHIDDKVGSVKVGKHADLVIWSDHPLSIYARAEKTFVDGLLLFDLERDAAMREFIKKDRARIVQKMLEAKKVGKKTEPVQKENNKLYHCDDIEDEMK